MGEITRSDTIEKIYITIGNVSVSGRGSCPEGIPVMLVIWI